MSLIRMASDRLSNNALISDWVEAMANSIPGAATAPPPTSVAAAPISMISRRVRSIGMIVP